MLVAAIAVHTAAPDPAAAVHWPWEDNDPWPRTSERAARPLDHPPVERWWAGHDPAQPYRFALFGDQRALADGEWSELLEGIAAENALEPIAFVVDTGDIVEDGSHSDQFHFLRDLLHPIRDTPYLVGLGNHEVDNNRTREARENAAAFLSYLDPEITPDRFYYRKDLGAATFLFLDTNDFVYGEDGDRKACPLDIDPATREGAQMRWIREQMADLRENPPAVTVVVMHHPLVQSSEKHLNAACSMWNFQDKGEILVDLLADGGVDLIVTGHTHTYERFRMVRSDGHTIDLINISGRPRDKFLWFGSRERRARDIRGQEGTWLDQVGWLGLDHWGVVQEDVMARKGEANQFAILTVEPAGGVVLELFYLDDDEPGGFRRPDPVRLR
ncbi:MAG: hypothetical protein DHS20C21_17570 [Gemmatimonadota bacterium]|nr:MAG: hypothetical protein DHS20C21_17570 [Gemmatimonadota bacterium]